MGLLSDPLLILHAPPPSSDSSPLVKPLRVLPVTHRTPRQSQSFPEQQTSVLSQQQTSVCLNSRHVLSCKSRHLSCLNSRHLQHLRLPGGHDAAQYKSCQKPLSFSVFELATTLLVRERRRSVSPSIDFYNNFSHPSSAGTPPTDPIGLLKIRQNPSVQALFGE